MSNDETVPEICRLLKPCGNLISKRLRIKNLKCLQKWFKIEFKLGKIYDLEQFKTKKCYDIK